MKFRLLGMTILFSGFITLGTSLNAEASDTYDSNQPISELQMSIENKNYKISSLTSQVPYTSVEIEIPESAVKLQNEDLLSQRETKSKGKILLLSKRTKEDLEKNLESDLADVIKAEQSGSNELSNTNNAASVICRINYKRESYSGGWLYGLQSVYTRWILRPGGSVSSRSVKALQIGPGITDWMNKQLTFSPGNAGATKNIGWTARNLKVYKGQMAMVSAEVTSKTSHGNLNLTVQY
jgi:hypothetical protein